MKTTWTLPEKYGPLCTIDLQKDKKLALLVNILALVIFVAVLVIGIPICSPQALFDLNDGLGLYIGRIAALIVGLVAYIFLHEWVHGIFIYLFSGKRAHYGFTGLYAYAGSEAYFGKRDYLAIALAPIVVWGIVLALLCIFVPRAWFWVAYFIQACNLSGAAGDLYVTWKFSRLPKLILVQDTGVAMTVFGIQGENVNGNPQ